MCVVCCPSPPPLELFLDIAKLTACTVYVFQGGDDAHHGDDDHSDDQGDLTDAQYAALLEQENRDVDRAIRESEQERDVIQVSFVGTDVYEYQKQCAAL
jgi:hypothetical protein